MILKIQGKGLILKGRENMLVAEMLMKVAEKQKKGTTFSVLLVL